MLTITCPKCNRSLSFNYASPGDVVMCRDCNLHLQSGTDGAVVLTDYQIDPAKLLPREDDRLFDRCPNCHVTIFGGGLREGRLRFCGLYCLEHYIHPDFCADCLAETTAEAPASNSRSNGIGTDFFGGEAKCSICFSVIRRRSFCVLLIPICSLGHYRVKYCTPGDRVTVGPTFKARYLPPARLRELRLRTTAPPIVEEQIPLTPVEWVLCLFWLIGFWVGIFRVITGRPNGGKMIVMSILSAIIVSVINVLISRLAGS